MHVGKIFVSFLDGLHYRPSFDPTTGRSTFTTCWGTDQPDPYVNLSYLYWVLYQRDERRLLSSAMIAAQLLGEQHNETESQERLRRMTVPADSTYTWHYVVCFLRGQALAGVLLYKHFQYKFRSASRTCHRRHLERLNIVTRGLPSNVVADLKVWS